MGNFYRKGISLVEFATDEAFTTPITINDYQITKEGLDLPEPEVMTTTLATEQDAHSGIKYSFSLRAINVDSADVSTLVTAMEAHTVYYVRFTSKDGKTTMILKKVLLRVAEAPFVVEGFGAVQIAGDATGIYTSDAVTIAYTP